MTFSEYMKNNPPTEEQKQQAERERAEREAEQRAQQEAIKAAEEEKARRSIEPSKEDKEEAARLYKEIQNGLLLGKSPAALLLQALRALALLHRTPMAEQDKQREMLETIQGFALGDKGARGVELAEIEERLKMLSEALADSSVSYMQKHIIERSIKANRKRLKALHEEAKAQEQTIFD